jgi:hypothetical protein
LDASAGELVQQGGDVSGLNGEILFNLFGWDGLDPDGLVANEGGDAGARDDDGFFGCGYAEKRESKYRKRSAPQAETPFAI